MGTSSVKCPDCKKEKNSKLVIYDNPIAIKENNGNNIEDMSIIKAKKEHTKPVFLMIIWISFDIIIYQWENRLNEDMVYIYICNLRSIGSYEI